MNKEFSIKHNGLKYRARVLSDEDTITKHSLHTYRHTNDIEYLIKSAKFLPSGCVGDKVGNHPYRLYIEIVSPHYEGESVRETAYKNSHFV